MFDGLEQEVRDKMMGKQEKELYERVNDLQKQLKAAKKQIDLLSKRNNELEVLSITDALTCLYNQRHFHDRLEQMVEKHRRQQSLLCLLFFDVDGLKTYNDTYGHLGGDDLLKAVAHSVLQNIKGNSDSGYRCGGDEFAVILPDAHAERAIEVARGIKQCLRESGFRKVTLSFGIAELSPEMDSKTLIRHADDAMYMAKRGRGLKPDTPTDKIYVYD